MHYDNLRLRFSEKEGRKYDLVKVVDGKEHFLLSLDSDEEREDMMEALENVDDPYYVEDESVATVN